MGRVHTVCSATILVFVVASCVVAVAGCSDTADNGGEEGTGVKHGLIILGNASVKTVPSAEHDLKVFLFESGKDGAKGIGGQKISFSFLGNAGNSQIKEALVTTDDEGRGGTSLTVGPTTKSKFQVQAVAGAYPDVKPVYFSFDLVTMGKNLKIVGDQQKNVWTKQKVTLSVKVTQIDYTKPGSPEQPLQGEDVTFKIVKDAAETITADFDKSADPYLATAKTTLSGNASVVFYTGEDVRTYYVNASAQGVQSKDIEIIVKDRGSGPAGCTTSRDCGPDEICANGVCTPTGSTIPCDQNTPCPTGYECINNECKHGTECPAGYHLDPGGPGGAPTCVADDPNSGCKIDADCKDPNMYCDGGVCKPLRPSCDSDLDCPSGFTCVNNQCVPKGGDQCVDSTGCPNGQICKNGTCQVCVFDADCPNGMICQAGKCDQPPQCGPYQDEDVGGLWYTSHDFDLSNALFGLPKFAGALDVIDQIFKGNLGNIGSIPIIGSILQGIIQDLLKNYIPPWVPNLIHALDSLANLFQTMKVEGEMQLWHLNPHELINGKEQWQSVILYWIDQCPGGRQDPNWPTCAEMDIVLADQNIKMEEPKDFTGRVDCNMLYIDQREVKMEMYKLVSFVVDLVVQIVTGYNDLQDAVDNMIDCAQVQQDVDDMACNMSNGSICSVPGVEAACIAAKATLPKVLTDWLAQQGVPTTFTFDGHATIVDDTLDKYADHLKDGVWQGKIQVLFDGKLTGTWSAER